MDRFDHLNSCGLTDIGRRRAANEDAIMLLKQHGVFMVADGIGGSAGGAGSSSALVDALTKLFEALPAPDVVRTAVGKSRLIRHQANLVSDYIKGKSDELGFRHAGTTAMIMLFDADDPTRAITLHAGDSPAYRFRGEDFRQITVDHTYASQLPPEAVEKMPQKMRGVITRAVGVKREVDLEENVVDIQPGDLYLLFSDGVTNMIDDTLLLGLIRAHRDEGLDVLAQAIVDTANENGGRDNISVVAIDVGETETPEPIKESKVTLAEPPSDE